VTDVGLLSDEELVSFVAIQMAWIREAFWRIFDVPAFGWKRFYRDTLDAVVHLDVDTIVSLRPFCSDARPLHFLMGVLIEQRTVHEEIGRRLGRRDVGSAILSCLREEPRGEKDLLTALKVERLTSYQPAHEEDDEDLRSVAKVKAWEGYAAIGEDMVSGMPARVAVPPLPALAGLPAEPKPPWDVVGPFVLGQELQSMVKTLLPVLREAEALRGKVHQDLRTHWEKRDAQKRKGEKVSLDEEKDAATQTDFSAGAFRQGALDSLYTIANRRWGERGTRFITALTQGETVTAASKAAKVTRQVGHKYLRELKKAYRNGRR
jgi:hypothetical protein